MTIPVPGSVEVDPPPLETYTYGLLSVARVITEDGRWQLDGVTYATDACAQGGHVIGSRPQPAPGGTSHDKPEAEGVTWVNGGGPFTVYTRLECSTVGFADPEGTALRRLHLIEPREVERVFSLQIADVDPRLPLGTEPVPLLTALGALEADAALHYAGRPTVHAPRWTQPHFAAARQVTPNGPMMRTELGSRIAFGGGYFDDPSEPAEPDPVSGRCWLIATGTVTARRSAPFAHQAVTPETNTRIAIAERTYALDADCYAAAVLLQLPSGSSEW
ncbi:hypothetical protein STBA_39050 [Streptomyces sp. MP131-18]|nr:hypothetical protein STBA_39050 [Streptomyces sp. MP131-18]